MGGYSFLGLSGGLDVQSLVSQIIYSEQAPIRRLDTRISAFQAKVQAYNDLNTRLSGLLSKLDTLSREASFSARKTTSSSDSVLTASAGGTALEGNYQITVQRLALWDNYASGQSFAAADSGIGTGSFELTVGSQTTTINIDETNNTLDGLRRAINSSGAAVNASIVQDGSGYRLTITSKTSGSANAIAVGNSTLTLDDQATPFVLNRTHTIAAAAELDAAFTVNGLSVTSSSNQVEGVIEGVTLRLRNTTSATVTLQVANDVDQAKADIQAFVDAYNQVYSFINSQFQYVPGAGGGSLAGEFILRDLQNQLAGIVGGQVSGLGGSLVTLAQLGVQMKNDGTLSIEAATLDQNLADNFDSIKQLFVAQGMASHGRVAYVGVGNETRSGTYQVGITTVPSAAVITAPSSIEGPLGVDEMLTFTLGGKSVQIVLESAMDLDAVIEALNAAFSSSSMGLTASRSGSELVVTSTAVGESASFTVTSDLASGGTGIGTSGLSGSGVSVAGTFTNTATQGVSHATGRGSLLTADEGSAKGLTISFSGSAPGDFGTVSVTLGFAEQLKRLLTRVTDSLEGPIQNAIQGYNSDIKSLQSDIESIQERLRQREALLTAQFSRANEALAQMQYLQASLSRQLSGLF